MAVVVAWVAVVVAVGAVAGRCGDTRRVGASRARLACDLVGVDSCCRLAIAGRFC